MQGRWKKILKRRRHAIMVAYAKNNNPPRAVGSELWRMRQAGRALGKPLYHTYGAI